MPEPGSTQPVRPHLLRRLDGRKLAVAAALILTTAGPVAFIRLDEPTATLNVVKALAKAGSIAGTLLLVWQLLLGNREVARRLHPDRFWLVGLHRLVGKWAVPGILLHPVFITVYYLLKHDQNILWLDLRERLDGFVLLGLVTLGMLAWLVVSSVWVRARLSYRQWYSQHLTAYLLLGVVFVHSYPVGQTLAGTGLKYVWLALMALAAALALGRVAAWAGLLSRPYALAEVQQQAPGIVTLQLGPRGRPIRPRIGQFVYARRGRFGGAHPYTVSHYDEPTGRLGLTVKDLGRDSHRWQASQPGDPFRVDGPYGVFTWSVWTHERPVVMIAGGIGITAFRRLLEALEHQADRPAWLFYGNTTPAEIVFTDELRSLRHVRVVHVMSEAPDFPGPQGFITPELLAEHLGPDLPAHSFLICGPPIMTQKLEPALRAQGVPPEQIHHELFSM